MPASDLTITYYDFANIYYASFFLTGFMENADAMGYRFVVSKKVPAVLRDQPVGQGWEKILFNMCLFKVSRAQEEFFFCVDTRDQSDMTRGMGYHFPLLEKVRSYFKVNFNPVALDQDPTLGRFRDKIVPVPLFFPLRMPRLIDFRPRLVPCRTLNWDLADIKRRIRALYDLLSVEEMRQFRNTQRDIHIFFVTTYYEQKHHAPEMEFRLQIMKEIRKITGINSVLGFTSGTELPEQYREFAYSQSDTRGYLSKVARSKVAIYVRGLHNCQSFKLGQLLFMGLPIVGQSIPNNAELLYANPYFSEQFAYDDPKTIVQKAAELLDQPETLASYGSSNAAIMDTRYTPRRITADIVMHLLALGA
jgi:hypothetical protein